MSNTHLLPDTASEVQAICSDFLTALVLSTTWPVVPVASLTLAAFATYGYVRDAANLIYVNQSAAPVTLSGADGAYWLALHRNTSTAVSSWTRQPGTHYLWRSNGTRPSDPPGGVVFAGVTLAGGVISAVDVTLVNPRGRVAFGGSNGALAFDPNLTWDPATGFLDVVAGGAHVNGAVGIGSPAVPGQALTVTGAVSLQGTVGIGITPIPAQALTVQGTMVQSGGLGLGIGVVPTVPLDNFGSSYLRGIVGIGTVPLAGQALTVGSLPSVFTGSLGIGVVPLVPLHNFGSSFLRDIVGVGTAPVTGQALTILGTVVQSGGAGLGIGVVPTFPLDNFLRSFLRSEVGIGTAPVTGVHLTVSGQAHVTGGLGLGVAGVTATKLSVLYLQGSTYGTVYRTADVDNGVFPAVVFQRVDTTTVGSITTTATATSFNTLSDARLKQNVTPLTGALSVVQALKPVHFRWKADDSQDAGFLAHELQQTLPRAVTGMPNAVDAAGTILPQGVDQSKLVVWLVGAVQELAVRVEALEG